MIDASKLNEQVQKKVKWNWK